VNPMMAGLWLLWILSGACGVAAAQTDTPEERVKAVERYFQEASIRDLMTDMVGEMSQQVPSEKRKAFQDFMLRNIRIDVLEAAAKQSLAKHLTVAEINVLTEFMRQPEGRSALGKMKYYMADLMPVIQQEVVRALKLSKPNP
jgi:hypothetical protein